MEFHRQGAEFCACYLSGANPGTPVIHTLAELFTKSVDIRAGESAGMCATMIMPVVAQRRLGRFDRCVDE